MQWPDPVLKSFTFLLEDWFCGMHSEASMPEINAPEPAGGSCTHLLVRAVCIAINAAGRASYPVSSQVSFLPVTDHQGGA